MAALHRPCAGGPLDGQSVRRPAAGWAYVDESGRCHSEPGAGRWLYLVQAERLIFAGYRVRRCEGCGAFVEAASGDAAGAGCPLCGLQ